MKALPKLTSLELCAGAGGQALGLEGAGFSHVALFENDPFACKTLRLNRPNWNVVQHDLFEPYDFAQFRGVDLLAGGLPCPPFSIAGKQLGEGDERNLFTKGVDIVEVVRPRAVMFENVKGMLGAGFREYRDRITTRLEGMGYSVKWNLLHASSFGVPQLRPRVVMIAVDNESSPFEWPAPSGPANSVGHALFGLMSSRGWKLAERWRDAANTVAPTIVGGSKKHGDRQVGNAFPPPVAKAVASAILKSLRSKRVEAEFVAAAGV
jgi:DNA (cytosine-5)-methyltransferase 1